MRIFLSVFILCFGLIAFGQAPGNDDCTSAIDLGTAPFCDSLNIFSNDSATASIIGSNNHPSCFKLDSAYNDVWFTFATSDADYYKITVLGVDNPSHNNPNPLRTPEIAIYDGTCVLDQLTDIECRSGAEGSTEITVASENLITNHSYFLRINSGNIPGIHNGNFIVCIEAYHKEVSIDQGGSPLCEGRVYDTGGPDSTYSNNEDYIFTICPDSFHNCLTLTMGDYLLFTKPGGGDYFQIYDGPDTTGTLIGSSYDMRDTSGKAKFTGISNSVCQEFHAESGCMTILWHTDSADVSQGFDARWICQQDSCPPSDSMILNVAPTDEEIISTLQGQLLVIETLDRNCLDTAMAIFDGERTDTKLASGLLLTTGRADSVAGPNDLPNYGFKNDTTGIALLDSLSKRYGDTTTTHDGCSVNVNFTPSTDVMQFEFTVGSEEYEECLMDQMNDLFGLFYTTAGHMGDPELNNYTNLAVFPGMSATATDIQIDRASPNDSMYWMYYKNNLGSRSIEYDGMLTAGNGMNKVILVTQNVEPCQINHLLAAIADRGDSLYDSGLFFSNMRCLTPTIDFVSGLGWPFFIETCDPGQGQLTFTFPRVYDEDTEWKVTFEGRAEQGTDFVWTHGDKIILPSGEQSVSYDIDVIDDGLNEGSESFKIKLSRDWGCGDVELTELDVRIIDKLEATITGNDGIACKGDNVTLMATGDLQYLDMTWQPESLFGSDIQELVSFIADQDVRIILTGKIKHPTANCTWSDTLDIRVIDPQVSIDPTNPEGICVGESIAFTSTDNVNGNGRIWTVTNGIVDTPFLNRVVFTGTSRGAATVKVTVDTLGCFSSDEVTVIIDDLDLLDLIDDTQICFGDDIALTNNTSNPGTTTYTWSPASSLDNPSSHQPVARPTTNTTYTVQYVSENGFCTGQDEVSIEVIPDFTPELSDPGNPCVNRDQGNGFAPDTFVIQCTGIPDSILNMYNPSFSWSASGGISIISTNTLDASFIAKGNGSVTLEVRIGDCIETVTRNIEVSTPGIITIAVEPDTNIVNCADLILNASLIGGGNTTHVDESIIWFFTPEGGMIEDREYFAEKSLSAKRNTRSSGKISIGMEDANGCYHEAGVDVHAVIPGVLIPNVFTPNNDGQHDVFQVFFDEEDKTYDVRSIKIYNRLGNLVFEAEGNEPWDGMQNGSPAMSDVYLYVIEMYDGCGNRIFNEDNILGMDGQAIKIQGDVTLLR